MDKSLPKVEVLIVSLCLAQRREALLRAIETVVGQEGVAATPVVVVNGFRFDPQLFAELRRRPDVRVLYQEKASIFLARRLARENVTAPFFAMLDDDDELLPNALRLRVDALRRDPTADVVVTNGYFVAETGERLILNDIQGLRRDPLDRLLRQNWLATASGLFRTESVTADFFDVTLKTNDMTYLALRLGLQKRILFLDAPTYRKSQSPDSISLSLAWSLPAADTLRKMLKFRMPARIRYKLRRKYAWAMHTRSDYHLRNGRLGQAWWCHIRSLLHPSAMLDFGLYSRKLIARSVAKLFGLSPSGAVQGAPYRKTPGRELS